MSKQAPYQTVCPFGSRCGCDEHRVHLYSPRAAADMVEERDVNESLPTESVSVPPPSLSLPPPASRKRPFQSHCSSVSQLRSTLATKDVMSSGWMMPMRVLGSSTILSGSSPQSPRAPLDTSGKRGFWLCSSDVYA